MKVDKKYGYLIVDGKYFRGSLDKSGRAMWKETTKTKVNKMEKKAKDIAKELKNSLDREKVLLESIMKLDETEIDTLHNVVFNKKRKVKPKTREHHCVDMKVGNFVLPIVD